MNVSIKYDIEFGSLVVNYVEMVLNGLCVKEGWF